MQYLSHLATIIELTLESEILKEKGKIIKELPIFNCVTISPQISLTFYPEGNSN